MIYLKVKEDETIEYPYSINQLKNDYPNTSFPDNITNDVLLEYGIHTVINVNIGYDIDKNYKETTPILIEGKYYQNWIIVDVSAEGIEQKTNNKWSEVRSMRNQYLTETDWTQLFDSPLAGKSKEKWLHYRQSLRNVTKQEDPFNIIWPLKPQ